MVPRSHAISRLRTLVFAAALGMVPGCALTPVVGPVGSGPSAAAATTYHYFAKPGADDPWSPVIRGWQSRELAQPSVQQLRSPASVSDAGGLKPAKGTSGNLRAEYFAFRQRSRRELARQIALWVQREARTHYVPDGPIDHWATLQETLARNGDDCDGLELLAYHFLLDLGYGKNHVFRAVVTQPSTGQYHMVTLWFENPHDPWVIDPTGAMTTGMPRMSQVKGWVPVRVFSETAEYAAVPASSDDPPASIASR